MKNDSKLKWKKLKHSYQPSDFSFKTTREVLGKEGIIGQHGAEEALALGLKINAKGYNIYVIGDAGIGKLNYVTGVLKQYGNSNLLSDIIYLYNFKMPNKPKALLLQKGDGKRLQEDMEEFVAFLNNELGEKLDAYEADKKRQKLILRLEAEKEEILSELNKRAKEMGFVTRMTKEGLGFIPIDEEGKPLTEEVYESLPKKEKEQMQYEMEEIYSLSEEWIQAIRDKETLYAQYLEDIDYEIVLKEVGYFMKHLKDKYGMYEGTLEFLDGVYKDVLEHIGNFVKGEATEGDNIQELFPWLVQKGVSDLTNKYKVNVLVDHSETTEVPIITSRNPTYNQLLGRIQGSSELTGAKIEIENIVGGLFHQAIGGYLVLYAEDLLENVGSWEAIKKVLKTGEIRIESMQGSLLGSTSSVEAEPIKENVKIVLLGDERLYSLLASYDHEFKKLFKVCVYLESEIASNRENINELASYVKTLCEKEYLPEVTVEGILEMVRYGNRLAESQDKMTANIENLLDLVREAAIFSKEIITEASIKAAIGARGRMKEQIEKDLDEKYKNEVLMVNTNGRRVGEINGLAVYTTTDYQFGRPVKITATTYRGQSGITDIEKEAGLGGKIHTKGIQIITGFLGSQYAQNMPLSLSCRICLEQSYGGIDGDSASSAELYAVLSSLAETPIRQNFAVTGSINQCGQIQPIGGVNEKIEGFFRVCRQKGLVGSEGVIIPYQNTKDLVLSDEVIEAVKMGRFHIYAIKDFKEGIELLTGYPYNLIREKVIEKLSFYNKVLKIPKRISDFK